MTPVRPTDRRLAPLFFAGILLLLFATLSRVASAQHDSNAGSAPPPPPGPGQLTVQILAEGGPESLGGLSIALYALAPDGTPGLMESTTDLSGRATFSGISNDPGIVYLVGARYAKIPFGERVAFAAGQTEARVEIKVSSPTDVVSGVSVDEIRTRLDWMGDRVVVTEILRLASAGDRVIQLAKDDPKATILERLLPPNASDFSAGPNSLGDGLTADAGKVRFWGPLYPGDQRVEYRYSLPVDPNDRRLLLPIELREAAGRVVVVAGTSGLEVSGPGLIASREVASDSGQALASWARGALPAGQRIEIAMTLPESRLDARLLSIPRGDVWIDLDDTRVNANVDLQIVVEPGAPVAGNPDAPLLHVTIPAGASLEGVSPASEAMGLIPTAEGFDLIGPIGPGAHSLGFSYRIASRPDGVQLGMRFPREVATLNVLVADTGLALDSSRLHRRRPFRSGTRNFLHREAFNVGPDEVVDLSLEPLRATGLPQQASLALTVLAACGAVLFLIAPLRKVTQAEVKEDPELVEIRDAREAVYVAIGDLDHDFETGKLEASDHSEMRTDLLAQAVELLRSERTVQAGAQNPGATPSDPGPSVQEAAVSSTVTATEPSSAAPPATGRFCPNCGGETHAQWKFCSHCGGPLQPPLGPVGDAAPGKTTA